MDRSNVRPIRFETLFKINRNKKLTSFDLNISNRPDKYPYCEGT